MTVCERVTMHWAGCVLRGARVVAYGYQGAFVGARGIAERRDGGAWGGGPQGDNVRAVVRRALVDIGNGSGSRR